MLASFLAGIALGSALASRWAATPPRRPRSASPPRSSRPARSPGSRSARPIGCRDGPTALGASVNALAPGALLAVAMLLPLTLCVGATFPFAVRLLARDARDASAASARVYAWNTLGSIAGAIGTGYFLLPWLGFVGTLVAAALANLALALAASLLARPARRALAAAAVAAALVPGASSRPPRPDRLLRASPLGGAYEGPFTYLAVGRSSTVALIDQGMGWRLTNNGLPESFIRPAGYPPERSAARMALDPARARAPRHRAHGDHRTRRGDDGRGGAEHGGVDRRDRARAGGGRGQSRRARPRGRRSARRPARVAAARRRARRADPRRPPLGCDRLAAEPSLDRGCVPSLYARVLRAGPFAARARRCVRAVDRRRVRRPGAPARAARRADGGVRPRAGLSPGGRRDRDGGVRRAVRRRRDRRAARSRARRATSPPRASIASRTCSPRSRSTPTAPARSPSGARPTATIATLFATSDRPSSMARGGWVDEAFAAHDPLPAFADAVDLANLVRAVLRADGRGVASRTASPLALDPRATRARAGLGRGRRAAAAARRAALRRRARGRSRAGERGDRARARRSETPIPRGSRIARARWSRRSASEDLALRARARRAARAVAAGRAALPRGRGAAPALAARARRARRSRCGARDRRHGARADLAAAPAALPRGDRRARWDGRDLAWLSLHALGRESACARRRPSRSAASRSRSELGAPPVPGDPCRARAAREPPRRAAARVAPTDPASRPAS